MKELLERTPQAIAAITFAVIVLGFTHEWAYFSVVGPQLQPLLGPTDYLNSSISWLPLIILALLLRATIELGISRAENFKSEEEILANFKSRRAGWLARKLPQHLTTLLVVLPLAALGVLHFFFGNPYTLAIMIWALAFVWGGFCTWTFRHEKLQALIAAPMAVFVFFAPIFWAAAYVLGRSDGYFALIRTENIFLVITRSEKGPPIENNWVMLRNLTAGILARDPSTNQIIFVRREEVLQLARKVNLPDLVPLSCSWFSINCSVKPPSFRPEPASTPTPTLAPAPNAEKKM